MHKLFIFMLLMFTLVACGANDTTQEATAAYKVISEAEIKAGSDVPIPSGEVILTISGDINTTNVDNTLQFDMETLEQLGLVEYSVDDQQAEGKVVTFQGVLLNDILNVAGISDNATNLNTIALNDYSVDIPLSDATDYPVMVATYVDGERMPIERYGPIRIVYPYESYELDTVIYDPRWIWQLSSIVVE